MTSPRNRLTPSDDELAARLRSTHERAVLRAAADPATGEIAAAAVLAGGRRRIPARSVLVVAAVAVVIVVAGVATWRKPIGPAPVGGSGAAPASVLPTVGPSTPAGPSPYPTPDLTTIYRVGSGAETQVATSADGAAFLVSGWVLGSDDPRACPSEPYLAPGVVSWDACDALWLHPGAAGGPNLVVYRARDTNPPSVQAGTALPVVILVHTHDQSCLDDSCRQLPVFLYTESVGEAIPIPSPTSTRPPTGLDAHGAAAAATAWASTAIPGYDLVRWTIDGPYGAIVANGSGVASDRWVWAVSLANGSTGNTYLVVIDYVTGGFLSAVSPAPDVSPAAGPDSPLAIAGQPVLGGDAARQAIGTSQNTPFLVGGWLLASDLRSCAADASTVGIEAAWNPCAGAWLHPTSDGGAPIALYTLTGSTPPHVLDGQALPVIFRVHTHDPAATGDDVLLPIIERVAWTGAPVAVASTGAPTGGISAATAERLAMAVKMGSLTTMRFSFATTLAGLKSLTGWDLSSAATTPDSWVWVVVRTDGSSPARTAGCAIVDMQTGKVLGGMRPYP